MPFDTAGAYTGLSNSFNDAVTGTIIDPSDWNALFADIENGLNGVAGGTVYVKTDVASASTCDIGAAATVVVRVTGTTTITSFGTSTNRLRLVYFAAALTLTHNGTSLILPGAANIVTVAGDTGIFISDASGNWRCIQFNPRASSETVAGILKIATTTQTLAGTDDATAISPLKLKQKLPIIFASEYGVSTSNTAAANTTAMNSLITAVNSSGGTVWLPQGTLAFNAWNSITGNSVTIRGCGRYSGGTTLSFANATGDCITFSGAAHSVIEDCWITASVRRTANFAIKVTGSCFFPVLRNLRIDYQYNGIWVHTAAQASISQIHCRYMFGSKHLYVGGASGGVYGLGVTGLSTDNPYPTGAFGTVRTWSTTLAVTANDIINVNGYIYQCSFSGTTSGSGTGPSTIPGTGTSDAFSTEITDGTAKWKFVSDATLVGAYIDSFSYSIALTDCQFVSANIGWVVDDTVASGSSYPFWIDTYQVDVDHSYSMNVALLGGESVTSLDDWYGSSLQSYGVYIGPSFRGEALIGGGTRISGCWLEGVYLSSGAVNVNVDNCKIYLNSIIGSGTSSGIKVAAGGGYFKFTNNTIGKGPLGTGSQKYGIEIAVGGSDHYVIVGNMLHGNATGALSDGGTGTDKEIAFNPPAITPRIYAATFDVGHASDTTLSRASAGQLAVEGVNVLMNGGALGTPASGTLTNATGLPVSTGISGLGTGVATFLATPSNANLEAALTGKTTVVGSLPSAATAGAGYRYFVTDANATTFASVVAGGGANGVPVYSDGTNWRIG